MISNDNFKNFINNKIIDEYEPLTNNTNDLLYIVSHCNIIYLKLSNQILINCLKDNNNLINILHIDLNDKNKNSFLKYLELNKPINKLSIQDNLYNYDLGILKDILKYNDKIKELDISSASADFLDDLSKIFKYNNTIKTLRLNFALYTTSKKSDIQLHKFKLYEQQQEIDPYNNPYFEIMCPEIDNLLSYIYNYNNSLENLYINDILHSGYFMRYNFCYLLDNEHLNKLIQHGLKNIIINNCKIDNLNGLDKILKSNKTLQYLDLSNNNIKNIDNIIEALSLNTTLLKFNLKNNKIDNIEHLHKIFITNKTLKEFNISYNNKEYDINYFKSKLI